MELFVKNIRAADGKIVKTLFTRDEVEGVETAIAYSRDFGFSLIYPMDRESEDNARRILAKAVQQNYEGKATDLMK